MGEKTRGRRRWGATSRSRGPPLFGIEVGLKRINNIQPREKVSLRSEVRTALVKFSKWGSDYGWERIQPYNPNCGRPEDWGNRCLQAGPKSPTLRMTSFSQVSIFGAGTSSLPNKYGQAEDDNHIVGTTMRAVSPMIWTGRLQTHHRHQWEEGYGDE